MEQQRPVRTAVPAGQVPQWIWGKKGFALRELRQARCTRFEVAQLAPEVGLRSLDPAPLSRLKAASPISAGDLVIGLGRPPCWSRLREGHLSVILMVVEPAAAAAAPDMAALVPPPWTRGKMPSPQAPPGHSQQQAELSSAPLQNIFGGTVRAVYPGVLRSDEWQSHARVPPSPARGAFPPWRASASSSEALASLRHLGRHAPALVAPHERPSASNSGRTLTRCPSSPTMVFVSGSCSAI